MDLDLSKNKIKLCVVGSGDWGTQVAHVAEMFSRFDLLGVINSSTSQEEKENLLKEAHMVYIAVPSTSQMEYVKYCIDNDKYTICEAPFLNSQSERLEIFEKIKKVHPRLFFVNSAYYMDTDFARIITGSITSNSKFTSIKCLGPKYQNDESLAKKFYINQAIFLILQIAYAKKIQKFDKLIKHDEYSGEFSVGSVTFYFAWENSEFPHNEIKIHTEDGLIDKTLIYDKYDHIFPMFKFMSDQYYGIFAPAMRNQNEQDIKEIYRDVNLQSYLLSCTAEYFSDMFCYSAPSTVIDDPLKLFFNAGF